MLKIALLSSFDYYFAIVTSATRLDGDIFCGLFLFSFWSTGLKASLIEIFEQFNDFICRSIVLVSNIRREISLKDVEAISCWVLEAIS